MKLEILGLTPTKLPICGPAFFTCVLTRNGETHFLLMKNMYFRKKKKKNYESPLILFIFKGKKYKIKL